MTKNIFFSHAKSLTCSGVCLPCFGDNWSTGLRILQPLREWYAYVTPLSLSRYLLFLSLGTDRISSGAVHAHHRIMEYAELEGACHDHRVPTPGTAQGTLGVTPCVWEHCPKTCAFATCLQKEFDLRLSTFTILHVVVSSWQVTPGYSSALSFFWSFMGLSPGTVFVASLIVGGEGGGWEEKTERDIPDSTLLPLNSRE